VNFIEVTNLDGVVDIVDIFYHLGLGRRAVDDQCAEWPVQRVEDLGGAPIGRAQHRDPRARKVLRATHLA
jgi:hypothetical protein